MKSPSRVTILGRLAACVCLFGVASTGCGKQGQEASVAEVSVVMGSVTDYNEDDRSDLFVVTKTNAGYSGIMLVSEGEGKFRLLLLRDASTEMPRPGVDSSMWEDRGLREINGPHDDVEGLDDALSTLPDPQRVKLGLLSGKRDLAQCSNGSFCFWQNKDFGGAFGWLANGQSNPNIGLGTGWNDRISSWSNRTDQWYSLWEHDNYGGGCFNQVPGNGVQNAEDFALCSAGCGVSWFDGSCCRTVSWNDKVTSIRTGTGNCADADWGAGGYDCSNVFGC